MSFFDPIISGASSAFDFFWDAGKSTAEYLNNNQWAADALKGAATGAAQYMNQRDQIKALEREGSRDREFKERLYYAKSGDIDMKKYDFSNLAGQTPFTSNAERKKGLLNQ